MCVYTVGYCIDMNTNETKTIDREAESRRYRRYGRTADRLTRMGRSHRDGYRGRYAHEWFSLARSSAELAARATSR